MFIVDSPGRLVGYIHCRTCYRCVHVDPEIFPPAPAPESYRARLRCSKCGGRGADIRIGWATSVRHTTGSMPQASGRSSCVSERTQDQPHASRLCNEGLVIHEQQPECCNESHNLRTSLPLHCARVVAGC